MSLMRISLTLGILARHASAIVASEGSQCDVNCGNVLSATTGADVVCAEADYTGTNEGVVFESCVECESRSRYTNDNDENGIKSDMQAMLYNLRFTVDYCMFKDDGSHGVLGDNPCRTETGCGALIPAISNELNYPNATEYSYCQYWDNEALSDCTNCLRFNPGPNTKYLANFFDVLGGACDQRLAPGVSLGLEGDIFSTDDLNVTAPTPVAPVGNHGPQGPLSAGEIAGVVFGGLVAILIVAGCCVVNLGKRRRRAYLQQREQLQPNWPSPQGAGEMLETPVSGRPPQGWSSVGGDTPVSQRPLRGGWDDMSNGTPLSARPLRAVGDSPMSAYTDSPFPRTYTAPWSPYRSEFNSPVSALDTSSPALYRWPTNGATQPVGMAMSPSTPQQQQQQQQESQQELSEEEQQRNYQLYLQQQQEQYQLHQRQTQWDNAVAQHLEQQQNKGKDRAMMESQQHQHQEYYSHAGHEYELQEGVGRAAPPPVLKHPGYGRNSVSPPSSRDSEGRPGQAM